MVTSCTHCLWSSLYVHSLNKRCERKESFLSTIWFYTHSEGSTNVKNNVMQPALNVAAPEKFGEGQIKFTVTKLIYLEVAE